MNKISAYQIKAFPAHKLSQATFLWTNRDGYVIIDPAKNIVGFTLTKQDAKTLIEKMILSHTGKGCKHCGEAECYLDCPQDELYRTYLKQIIDQQYEKTSNRWEELINGF